MACEDPMISVDLVTKSLGSSFRWFLFYPKLNLWRKNKGGGVLFPLCALGLPGGPLSDTSTTLIFSL